MKTIIVTLIILLSLVGCNSEKQKTQTPQKKQNTIQKREKKPVKKGLLSWTKDDAFGGTVYRFHGIEFILTELFTPKGEGTYFAEGGINLMVARDQSNISLNDYLLHSSKQLKKVHRKAVLLERKSLTVNGEKAVLAVFMIDKARYMIQIRSIIIEHKGEIYTMSITGKRKALVPMQKLIEQIFRSIEFK